VLKVGGKGVDDSPKVAHASGSHSRTTQHTQTKTFALIMATKGKNIRATAPKDRQRDLTNEVRTHAKGARSESLHQIRVGHAVACGKALLQLRELLGHGNWTRWLEEECRVNRMTANRYMRLASHKGKLKRDMTIREAYLAAGVIAPKQPKAQRVGRV
jgi:hypothetical protein